MPDNTRLIVADDHPILRAGLVQIINHIDGFHIVGQADNGIKALELIRQEKPDIALLDIRMPGLSGIRIMEKMVEEGLSSKVLLLTMHKNTNYLFKAVSLGVKGFLLKNSTSEELAEALLVISSGGTYISKTMKSAISHNNFIDCELSIQSINSLTSTERKILKLISRWKSNKEISEELFISPRTVGNHRTNVATKLNLKGIHGIIRFAIENQDLF